MQDTVIEGESLKKKLDNRKNYLCDIKITKKNMAKVVLENKTVF